MGHIGKSGSTTKSTNNYNQTSGVNNQTNDWLSQIMAAARGAGQSGPSPLLTGASGFNSGLMDAGANGAAAMGGDPSAIAKFMNPYQQNVIDAINKQGVQQDAMTTNQLNDQATKAGAFGGTRQGVAQGIALSQNALGREGLIGGLLSSGYQNAMQNAQTAANMGFMGAGQNANLGMGGVGNAQQWLMNMLNQGFRMPTGTNTTGGGANWQGQYGASMFIGK